jgi:hypothetical protein
MGWRLIYRWPGFGTRWACTSAVSAVADAGLVVPSDVSVTGYDDTFVAAIRQVSLTSVNPDSSGIGTQAAHCVLRRIEDPGRAVEELLLLPRLVTRFSSGVPAGRFGGCGAGPGGGQHADTRFGVLNQDAGRRSFWPAGRKLGMLQFHWTCPRASAKVRRLSCHADTALDLRRQPSSFSGNAL